MENHFDLQTLHIVVVLDLMSLLLLDIHQRLIVVILEPPTLLYNLSKNSPVFSDCEENPVIEDVEIESAPALF